MIMVLMGGNTNDRDAVIRDLMQLYKGRIQCVNVAHLSCPLQRVERLKMEVNPKRAFRVITLVNNPTSVEEVNELRRVGAHFAHMYGPLTPVYDHISMASDDVQVAPIPHRHSLPAHVLTPEETVSEFMLRGRPKVA
ncbi:hypothetical protein NAL94_23785 (plasmid) [Vibrio alginolyticus]|uniref:hypothetical protein n=1 Tax=Vibrio TaxID=662 RepID=UPI0014820A59|nr:MULTISPECIES: hypothetical protein [Vibrio]EGQ7740899.1 hypothetical protein [Vibrio parahaemolyticus]EIU6870655.1 hypothetical protein [Vibrio parahaemolyticus]EJG1398999.1 hypothetical protein [Vibrio parahaemolyticus]MDF5393022.1 hypothetical protein [Vibrio parahaemolyticus]MDF5398951.1 hypothetical protein [Vibrio parahaemolyticus]